MRALLAGIGLYLIGQVLTWFQTNGQFISPWIKNHPLIISVVGGTAISYAFIKATALIASYYDGLIWPGRFITGFVARALLIMSAAMLVTIM